MMDKLAKAQKNWMSKLVLILTALSFMSLFGVSGYLTSASNNKPVIKVDDIKISQSQFSALFEQEQQMARNLFGENLDMNDNIRNAMLQGVVQRELTNAIIERTAQEYNINISDNLVRKIIYSQADFLDANGNFSLERLRRVLSASGWTEQRYIEMLKKDIIKQQLIQNPSANVNVPKVLIEKLAQVENQKKIFKYLTVDPNKVKIDRKISKEEIEQYYQDFNSNFIEPEKRDVSFIVLSIDDMAAKVVPNEEDIKAYYEENIAQFEVPETRNILQMVFDKKENADKALTQLNVGKDFYQVASDVAGQSKQLTDLGFVSKDLVIADMADEVFAAKVGQIAGPVKSDMGWHIMKVANIKAGSKMNKDEARSKIFAVLKKERAYDEAYSISSGIEDKIGGGSSLEDIAKEMKVKVLKATDLSEDGKSVSETELYNNILKSNDFVDTAFSYNIGEISQVIETEQGFVVIRVDGVNEAHPIAIEKVTPEIEKMWELNERSAIAQEIVNDVMHDIENGDKIDEVAQRFSLNVKTTRPLQRSESFEGLSPQNMIELFQEQLNTPKTLNQSSEKIIAVTDKVIGAGEKPSQAMFEGVKRRASLDLSQDLVSQLVDSFGRDYDVRVKYRLIGLSE